MTSSRRALPIDELPPEVRARVTSASAKQDPEPSPGRRVVDEQVERSLRGRRRQRAGAGFEAELEGVHQLYQLQHRARVIRIKPQSVWNRRLKQWVLAGGGGPCDFRGTLGGRWNGRAVVFDAKSWEHAVYAHDVEQRHQLQELLDEQATGAIAFLLIRCAAMGIAYVVHDRPSLELMSRARAIELRTAVYAGAGSGRRKANDPDGFTHHFPTLRAPSELLVSQSVPRWDWLSLLDRLEV